ncbi:MAG: efflux RND transporter periplasmic adaptor subunit [Planctomycetota bacterium]
MARWWWVPTGVTLLGMGASIGWMARGHNDQAAPKPTGGSSTLWTCPMHPQVRLPDNVPCPACGMDLVPLKDDGTGHQPVLQLTHDTAALAGIRLDRAKRRDVDLRIRMAGAIAFDETRVRGISARVSGWVERMYLDFTGIHVQEGDHLVRLYSPELLTAQQELLAGRRKLTQPNEGTSEFLQQSDARVVEVARHKLRLLGLSPAQIAKVEQQDRAEDHVLIRAPASGVVIDRVVEEGDYVAAGAEICRVAELDRLWLLLQAYEQDLPWIRYGQEVTVAADAYPGEEFRGWVSWINPTVDRQTRTVSLRVTLDNAQGRLKPGMFARAYVSARLGASGAVLDPRLTGKWIGPMHPEVIHDRPGVCELCGMDLVSAASLGYAGADQGQQPLTVPAAAVLRTGRRALVYVATGTDSEPKFEGREVVLGPRAGPDYIVLAGLREGERVVIEGAFKLDSELQLRAKPSMMSMEGEEAWLGARAAAFRANLGPVFQDYLATQRALADDDARAARTALRGLLIAIQAVDDASLRRNGRAHWTQRRQRATEVLRRVTPDADLARLRDGFRVLSRVILELETSFGHPGAHVLAEAHCPMAAGGHGASWLQEGDVIANPFFGASMLRCGTVERRHPGRNPGADATPGPGPVASGPVTSGPVAADPPAPTTSAPSAHAPAATATVDEAPPADVASTPDWAKIYTLYFALQDALAGDDWQTSTDAARALAAAAPAAPNESSDVALGDAAAGAAKATDISALREAFRELSNALIAREEQASHHVPDTYFEVHCPMAFDDGASWLQRDATVRNPYYGASMLGCGRVTRQHTPAPSPR